MPRSKTLRSVGDIISNDPAFAKFKTQMSNFEVIERFYEIFPSLENHVVAVKIMKETIHLKVEDSVWRSEIKFREATITEQINSFFKSNIVSKIKFIS